MEDMLLMMLLSTTEPVKVSSASVFQWTQLRSRWILVKYGIEIDFLALFLRITLTFSLSLSLSMIARPVEAAVKSKAEE